MQGFGVQGLALSLRVWGQGFGVVVKRSPVVITGVLLGSAVSGLVEVYKCKNCSNCVAGAPTFIFLTMFSPVLHNIVKNNALHLEKIHKNRATLS